ncbi:hypothetical protein ACFQ0B_03280 [Nonomuraea thailandensis]
MAIQLDPNWPGASDDDEGEDPFTNRPEVRRVAGELHELLKKLTTSSGIPVTEYAVAPGDPVPGPQLPPGAAPCRTSRRTARSTRSRWASGRPPCSTRRPPSAPTRC